MSVFPYHEFIVTSRFAVFFQCFCAACARLVHADVANVLRLSRETIFVLESFNFVLKVLRNGLLRYILYTCPNL